MTRFTYTPHFTGDGKRGLIVDSLSDFRAYVDRDDVYVDGVDEVAAEIVSLLNDDDGRRIPQSDWPEDFDDDEREGSQ
jgi:hypothetical protein